MPLSVIPRLRDSLGRYRSSIASIIVRLSGAGMTLVIAVVLARELGPEGYGAYSYIVALATLGAVAGQVGLPTLIVRESAKWRARDEWGVMRAMFVWALRTFCLSAALVVALIASARLLDFPLLADVSDRLLIGGLTLLVLIGMSAIVGAGLRGLHHVIQGQLPEQVYRPGFFLLALVVAIWLPGAPGLSAQGAIALHAGAAMVAAVLGAASLLYLMPAEVTQNPAVYREAPRWRSSLLPLGLLTLLQVVIGQADVLILGVFADEAEIGTYRVAWQIATVVNLILFAIGLTLEPAIARLSAQGETAAMQRLIRISGQAAFVLAVTVSVFLIIGGKALLMFVFGEPYEASYIPLIVLSVGQAGFAFFGWSVLVLNMTGHERTTARLTGYAAVYNVVANLLLTPEFGGVGAAVATASSLVLWKLALSRAARRLLSVETAVLPLLARGR